MKMTPNYLRPIVESIEVLKCSEIKTFPIDLKAIQKAYSNLFAIRSYSSFMEKNNISRETCKSFFHSEDGATIKDEYGRHIVFFNDKNGKLRNRFTIAHELGHIFLDHYYNYGVSFHDNGEVDEEQYLVLENEANCFARNLLCPLYHVSKVFKEHSIYIKSWYNQVSNEYVWDFEPEKGHLADIHPITLLAQCFAVSDDAADKRIAFLNADERNSKHLKTLFNQIKDIKQQARWFCGSCFAERLKDSLFCCSCGENADFFFGRKIGKSFHHGIKTTNNKLIICPVCGELNHSKSANYCLICGSSLVNFCSSGDAHNNHPEADYCALCGHETIFHRQNLTRVIHENIEKGEDYYMNYNDGVPVDENKRVIICPKCSNETFSDDAEYCRICGTSLYNYCEGNEEDVPFGYDGPIVHKCPGNARYCEICGSKTTYLKLGFLRPWDVVRNNIEKE